MSFLRRVLRKPVQLVRRAAGTTLPLETAVQFITRNEVPGDYLEFGVFRGESFARTYLYHQKFVEGFCQRNPNFDSRIGKRRFFAFDSFEGLPMVDQSGLPPNWRGAAPMSCAQGQFITNIGAAGVDLNHVAIVPGFYDRSLTAEVRVEHKLTEAALINVDCDLFESTVPVLEFVRPLVVDGTVISFDDWFYYKGHPKRGERGAFEQWLAKYPEIVASELLTSYPVKAFILNYRDS